MPSTPLRLTDQEADRARRILMRRDPRLAPVINAWAAARLPDSRALEPYAALIRAILAQQLSSKAAETIFGRVVVLVGGATTSRPLPFSPPIRQRCALRV